MDVHSKSPYPASAISNFEYYFFRFDDVACHSMEGLLQSFKFEETELQEEICKLSGMAAKRRGQERNKTWKKVQTLWWKGQAYNRHGKSYQKLLDRAFEALGSNEFFCRALLDSGNEVLTHSIGSRDPHETVLTEKEFCERLTKIRKQLRLST